MPATVTTTRPARSTGATRALWTAQILVGLFFVVASASPKLLGEGGTVEIFTEIRAGLWFRYLVGALELLDGGLLVLTPVVLGVVVGVIAWVRRGEIRGLLGR